MYSIVRDGVRNQHEDEFKSLLKKADHSYTDFEDVLSTPSTKGCLRNRERLGGRFTNYLKELLQVSGNAFGTLRGKKIVGFTYMKSTTQI